MINATFNKLPDTGAPLSTVRYPFLFQTGLGVYLRITQSQIVRLYAPDTSVDMQGKVVVGGSGPLEWSLTGEQLAWAMRLKPGESVTLSNP